MLLHEIFIIIYFVKKQMTFMVRSLVQYFAVEPGKYITWRLSESEDRGAEMKEVQYIPYSYISWAVSLQLTYVSLRCGWVHGHSKRELALLKERREIMVPEKFEVSVFDTLPYSIQTGRTLDPPVGRDPNDIRKEGERLLLNEIRDSQDGIVRARGPNFRAVVRTLQERLDALQVQRHCSQAVAIRDFVLDGARARGSG